MIRRAVKAYLLFGFVFSQGIYWSHKRPRTDGWLVVVSGPFAWPWLLGIYLKVLRTQRRAQDSLVQQHIMFSYPTDGLD